MNEVVVSDLRGDVWTNLNMADNPGDAVIGGQVHTSPALNSAEPKRNQYHLLFQEQARCMISIRDLSDQIEALQDFKYRVINAFPDLVPNPRPKETKQSALKHGCSYGSKLDSMRGTPKNNLVSSRVYLPSSRYNSSSAFCLTTAPTPLPPPPKKQQSKVPQKYMIVGQGRNWLRIKPVDDTSDNEDQYDSTSDSMTSLMEEPMGREQGFHRLRRVAGTTTLCPGPSRTQDSGFSTDGKDSRNSKQESDELMLLLEMIELQGMQMRLGSGPDSNQSSEEEFNQRVKVEAPGECLNELNVVKRENERLLVQIRLLNKQNEDNIECIQNLVRQNKQLDMLRREDKARAAETPASLRNLNGDSADIGATAAAGAKSLPARLLPSEIKSKDAKSRAVHERISAILRERSVQELRRQLLVAVNENDVLKAQTETLESRFDSRSVVNEQLQVEIEGLRVGSRELAAEYDLCKRDLAHEREKLAILMSFVSPDKVAAAWQRRMSKSLDTLERLGKSPSAGSNLAGNSQSFRVHDDGSAKLRPCAQQYHHHNSNFNQDDINQLDFNPAEEFKCNQASSFVAMTPNRQQQSFHNASASSDKKRTHSSSSACGSSFLEFTFDEANFPARAHSEAELLKAVREVKRSNSRSSLSGRRQASNPRVCVPSSDGKIEFYAADFSPKEYSSPIIRDKNKRLSLSPNMGSGLMYSSKHSPHVKLRRNLDFNCLDLSPDLIPKGRVGSNLALDAIQEYNDLLVKNSLHDEEDGLELNPGALVNIDVELNWEPVDEVGNWAAGGGSATNGRETVVTTSGGRKKVVFSDNDPSSSHMKKALQQMCGSIGSLYKNS